MKKLTKFEESALLWYWSDRPSLAQEYDRFEDWVEVITSRPGWQIIVARAVGPMGNEEAPTASTGVNV
jgi:hypothetical protein